MSSLSLSPLRFVPDELAEVCDLYASNPEYGLASGEYDSEHVDAAAVEMDLRESVAEGCEHLLARDEEKRVVGLVSLLHHHPKDGYPWIALLMVHGGHRRRGLGRRLAGLVEERFRDRAGEGIGLAVLENNPAALAFWSSLGWRKIDRRPDVQHGRPCIVMHKGPALT